MNNTIDRHIKIDGEWRASQIVDDRIYLYGSRPESLAFDILDPETDLPIDGTVDRWFVIKGADVFWGNLT